MAVVGDDWLDLIEREYLRGFVAAGGAAVKFVVGSDDQTAAVERGLLDLSERHQLGHVAIDAERLTENELSDFSRLWHDGCVEAIIEAQDVDRNHSTQV